MNFHLALTVSIGFTLRSRWRILSMTAAQFCCNDPCELRLRVSAKTAMHIEGLLPLLSRTGMYSQLYLPDR
jgi:hypothetical protein